MPDIMHKISINAPRERVYSALATVDGLAGWWTSTTSGQSEPGKTLEFRFGEHVCRMRVEAQRPGELLRQDRAEGDLAERAGVGERQRLAGQCTQLEVRHHMGAEDGAGYRQVDDDDGQRSHGRVGTTADRHDTAQHCADGCSAGR